MIRKIGTILAIATFGFTTGALAKENMQGAKAGVKPADAETVKLLMAINQNEINLANEAQKKQLSPSVGDYAKMISKEHSENLTKTNEIAQANQITPKDSPRSRLLEGKGEKEVTKLSALEGPKFEAAFIQAMIKGHTEALSIIKARISVTGNDALKTHLTETRDRIQSHLDQAKALKTTKGA